MAIEICKDEYIKSQKDTKSRSSEIRKVNILDIVKAYDSMSNSKVVNVLKSLRNIEIVVVIALMITMGHGRRPYRIQTKGTNDSNKTSVRQ